MLFEPCLRMNTHLLMINIASYIDIYSNFFIPYSFVHQRLYQSLPVTFYKHEICKRPKLPAQLLNISSQHIVEKGPIPNTLSGFYLLDNNGPTCCKKAIRKHNRIFFCIFPAACIQLHVICISEGSRTVTQLRARQIAKIQMTST